MSLKRRPAVGTIACTPFLSILKLRALHATTTLIICLLLGACTGCREMHTGSGPFISVELLADQTSVSPGSTFTLGVRFKPDPGWHIYWKNPGDSGLPPRFHWTSSPGVQIAEPLWPYPDRIPTGPLVNYGYASGEVLLPFQATLDSQQQKGRITAQLKLEWLVCKDECLPGSADLSLSLPVTPSPGAPSPQAQLFEKTYRTLPTPLDKVSLAIEEQEDQVVLAIIPLESRFLPSTAIFFPDDPKLIANAGPHSSKRDGDVLTVTLRRDKNRTEPITRLRGVLVSEQGWSPSGTPLAVHVDTSPGEAASGAPLGSTTTRPIHTQSTSSADVGFITAVIFALLGGFILNLMPCVFPVLSIKILSFIEQSNHDRKKIKLHGLLFALGVIVSFWILAGAMLIVRAGGAQLGWGFQLQSPPFVATMIVVFSALGVMFLSELTFGQRIQTIAGRARIPTSYLGSFLNGALATAVATPCTAPFMSTSLAATISLPASLSLVIFTALGVGMSVPYLILALRPSLVQRLPRPGAWMDIFKQLMAFPLFGTAIWLLRVFARQMGVSIQSVSPITNLLWGLLLLGFGVWLGVRAPQARRALSRAFVITFALCALCGGGTLLLRGATATPPRADTASSAVYIDSHGLEWLPYSEQRLTDLTLQGRNIYVDFTAEWCITCQTNKLVVFNSQDVLDLLRSKEVVLMRADWTSHDPAITAALASFGKNGVPLNILIRKGDRTKAHIMPNILTANVVRDALQTLP